MIRPSAAARRRRRAEAKVIASVRPEVAERDGWCRLVGRGSLVREMFGECRGDSQWAHYGERKRSLTRRMPPEHRHDRRFSLMLCFAHHDAYDHGPLEIEALDPAAVCDGRLRFSQGGQAWQEP